MSREHNDWEAEEGGCTRACSTIACNTSSYDCRSLVSVEVVLTAETCAPPSLIHGTTGPHSPSAWHYTLCTGSSAVGQDSAHLAVLPAAPSDIHYKIIIK